MDSEFNSYSFKEEIYENEIVLGKSKRFVFSKKRVYGKMHFLKRPSEEYKNDLITIESLRKEFSIGYSLDHPNIAKYIRFENDTVFEEYIDGKSLRELIEGNDPRLRQKGFLQNLCFQILDVLRYLREMGVVHNDIKPENLLITRIGNTVKLVDFNCAQSSDNDVLGGFTLSYKAPEQGMGRETVDCSSDLYQVGKVMEELCARAGYTKSWKRFIEGTTANNPANRISIDRSEKLIPKQHKINKLSLAFLVLSILIVGSIILFSKKETEGVTIQQNIPVKDTIVTDNRTSPSVEIIDKQEISNMHEIRNKEDIKKVIEKKISDHTGDYYKNNLYPICREALENDNRGLTAEEEAALQKAIEKAYRAAADYGVKLSSEYPEERGYIEKECLHIMEMKISSLLLKLYPATGV